MTKVSYVPVEWDLETPINVTNLNNMDSAISDLASAVDVSTGTSTTNPSDTDIIPMQNSSGNGLKINYSALAKAIIEQYEGSTLAGSEQSVQDAFTALVNQSTTDLATKEDKDSNGVYTAGSNSRAWYIKKHGFVHIWGSPGSLSFSANQWSNLGVTLPVGYRPSGTVSAPCIFGNQGQYVGLIRVAADGTVQCFCNTAISSQLIVFNFMYAVAG